MAFYVDTVVLLDRTKSTRTLVDSTQSGYTNTGIPNGDLTSWRKRLELVNTGETKSDNHGSNKLRIDDQGTFVKKEQILLNEDAKKKYLIEAKITQTIDGTSTDSKIFRFQLGNVSVTSDSHQGGILSISLQEIQRRTQEAFGSRELRFVSPKSALMSRITDFNSDQVNGVNILMAPSSGIGVNNMPELPQLEYIPQTAKSYKDLFDGVFENLSTSQAVGGLFTDYYYDYDPHPTATLMTILSGDKIGGSDSGVIVDPLSSEPIDSEESQSASTDFFRFRNHIVAKGGQKAGSLPTEHTEYQSKWLRAKLRDEFNSSGGNQSSTGTWGTFSEDGTNYLYLKGMVVKVTKSLNSFRTSAMYSGGKYGLKFVDGVKVVRFFEAKKNIPTSQTTSPDSNASTSYWKEDFISYPEFDKSGSYEAGDIVYYDLGNGSVRFYQAVEDIFDWTLNRFREFDGGSGTWNYVYGNGNLQEAIAMKHLNNSDGFLYPPSTITNGSNDVQGWRRLDYPTDNTNTTLKSGIRNGEGVIPVRSSTPLTWNNTTKEYDGDFAGYIPYSLWTQDVFDWEKNMMGLKTGSLPRGASAGHYGSANRYVGFFPDWNICKDVYEKQDPTDEFESITLKWVQEISNSPPPSKECYHGQRILVGTNPTASNWGSPKDSAGNTLTDAQLKNRLLQFDKNIKSSSSQKWRPSREPREGDVINNLDDAIVYQYNGTAWVEHWKIWRTASGNAPHYVNPSTPFHLIKDAYKVQGFEGTPNSAIEFRYVWDSSDNAGSSGITSNYHKSRNRSAVTGNFVDDTAGKNKESRFARKNSRGVWLSFWNPFPRQGHSDNGNVYVGDKYGGNADTSAPASGFTTLNIYNLNSDRKQSLLGWNNGVKSEDMGRISAISFKMKVGFYATGVDVTNDKFFRHLPDQHLVIGIPSIPMTFWAVDMFDRIWYHKFELRRNGYWDEVTIPFGDMSQANLYFPRFDELWHFYDRPLGFTNFALKEREYTGVAFDWRFVRGWGVQYDGSYDDNGYYNGGFDEWWDWATQFAEQFKMNFYNIYALSHNAYVNASAQSKLNKHEKMPIGYSMIRQATIAIDDIHYKKQLVANSDPNVVSNPRTKVENFGHVEDYITLKILARSQRERESFYPQFWHLKAIGDVRMRVGKSFKVKGDRIPEHPDTFSNWASSTAYSSGDKVTYNGYTWRAIQNVPSNIGSPSTSTKSYWENLNELSCAEVTHTIDDSGYHMEITGRRKFIVTGD